jgi:hypothetical protein
MELSMGLLMDIRSGRRNRGVGSVVFFWLLAGACAGSAVALFAPEITESGRVFFGLLGASIGVATGFYAAFGVSRLAKILEIPGLILDLALGFLR